VQINLPRASLEDVQTLIFRVAVLALRPVRLVANFATKGENLDLTRRYQHRGNVERETTITPDANSYLTDEHA